MLKYGLLKYGLTVLVSLMLVLLSSVMVSPTQATVANDTQVYIWDYVSVGSPEIACKQVIFHPRAQVQFQTESQPISIRSVVVDQSNCVGLARLN
ncbi:MAG: hypothetical protein ACRC8A_11185 [Microcoleaceae cyanobacterium]